MKFQNCILINLECTYGRMDRWKDGQAQSNMPLQFFQSWGHKNNEYEKIYSFTLIFFLKIFTILCSIWT